MQDIIIAWIGKETNRQAGTEKRRMLHENSVAHLGTLGRSLFRWPQPDSQRKRRAKEY